MKSIRQNVLNYENKFKNKAPKRHFSAVTSKKLLVFWTEKTNGN